MTDEKDLEMSPGQDKPQGAAGSGSSSEDEAQSDLAGGGGADKAAVDVIDNEAKSSGEEQKVVNAGDTAEDDAEAAMLAMLDELPDDDSSASADDINFGTAEVADAEFQQLSAPAASNDRGNIDMLMDVDLPVAIELGRTEMTINDILALGPGSVVELNKLAGEPVDLLVNSKVVARGEVVVVDENFGLRVTHLLTPEERLRSLAES